MDELRVPRVFCDLISHYPYHCCLILVLNVLSSSHSYWNPKPPNPLEDVSAQTSSEIFSKLIPDSELRIPEPNENYSSGQLHMSASFGGSNSIWRHMRPSIK
ncbi:hypothetical protein CDAR_230361 [Caerostris darwini]|uniref:Uncharacterized protein n=1 Tax=Caerostris darwini TaxID=1538125 RepID=A0AAV4QD25_9ARAC|nr:hypothetical protein CDAR_230361 [Caerostris darwini]